MPSHMSGNNNREPLAICIDRGSPNTRRTRDAQLESRLFRDGASLGNYDLARSYETELWTRIADEEVRDDDLALLRIMNSC